MSLPAFNMRELIEAGVHFGHKTKRWNPRMAPYIFGVRNDIHIIDLGKTVPLLHQALTAIRDVVAQNGRILFVGTKRQATDPIAEAAKRCGQYYINMRWLGGLLTNWNTIQVSIKTLRKLEEQLSGPNQGFTKKELLSMSRQREFRQLSSNATLANNALLKVQGLANDATAYNQTAKNPELGRILQSIQPKPAAH